MSVQRKPPAPLESGEGLIRCPAIRSLVKGGQLKHQNLETASVQDLVRALSQQDHELAPQEPGSLANVAGFFAISNHGLPEHAEDNPGTGLLGLIHDLAQRGREFIDAAAVAAGKSTSQEFDLRLFGSRGDHPGTVDFFENNEQGKFRVDHFNSVMNKVSNGTTLTIKGIAEMIIEANGRDSQASPVDLAKSSGEWALMVCALRANNQTTDILIADLEQMYSQAHPATLLAGTQRATAAEWVQVTAQIAATIAEKKTLSRLGFADDLHSVFKDINAEGREALCPCRRCNPKIWEKLD